jgi:DNA polymerase-3 subunit epsilon
MRQHMETLAVIDFETTGLGATQGGRATEIAAVLVQGGQIVGRFQSLMNSGAWVPPSITQLTGITNQMLHAAPPARAVMHEVARFTKGCPLVAHNAAFDRGFWQAELARAECAADEAHVFACTMLLSRRLYPHAENHRLGTLARLHALPSAGRAHRAHSSCGRAGDRGRGSMRRWRGTRSRRRALQVRPCRLVRCEALPQVRGELRDLRVVERIAKGRHEAELR